MINEATIKRLKCYAPKWASLLKEGKVPFMEGYGIPTEPDMGVGYRCLVGECWGWSWNYYNSGYCKCCESASKMIMYAAIKDQVCWQFLIPEDKKNLDLDTEINEFLDHFEANHLKPIPRTSTKGKTMINEATIKRLECYVPNWM